MILDERDLVDDPDSGEDEDDVAILNQDMLINLVAVMIALIGSIAALPPAQVAESGVPDPGAAPLMVYVTGQGRVSIGNAAAAAVDLPTYSRELTARAAADTTHSLPVVICLPDTIPSGHLIDILSVSAEVPGVTASLGSTSPPEHTRAGTDRSVNP